MYSDLLTDLMNKNFKVITDRAPAPMGDVIYGASVRRGLLYVDMYVMHLKPDILPDEEIAYFPSHQAPYWIPNDMEGVFLITSVKVVNSMKSPRILPSSYGVVINLTWWERLKFWLA